MASLKSILFIALVLPCVAQEFEFRLRGGGENHGIVEVKNQSEWLSICVRRFFDRDWATLLCSKLGLNSSHALNVDARRYPPWKEALRFQRNCEGIEKKVNCSVTEVIGVSPCSKYTPARRIAAVLCSDRPPSYRLTGGKTRQSGRFEVFINNTWGPVCSTLFSNPYPVVACKALGFHSGDARYVLGKYYGPFSAPTMGGIGGCHGNETSFEDCHYVTWAPIECQQQVYISCGEAYEGMVRLAGGYDEISGRVEIYLNDSWGLACYSGFDTTAAGVVCNNITTSTVKYAKVVLASASAFRLRPTVYIENITCYGNESSLLDCPHTPFGSFSSCGPHSYENAGVICGYGDEKLRLGQGGLLEVRHNGEWGTVCGPSFKATEARIACETLGLSSSFAQQKYMPPGGRRFGRIWMDEFSCNGSESSLFDCSFSEWGMVSCSHKDDISISCQDINTTHIQYALRGDPLLNVGYMLMGLDGQWGSVCDDGFGEKEAQVACRSAGRRTDGARLVVDTDNVIGSMKNSVPPEKIWLDEVKCDGTERSLMDCQHNYIGDNDCSLWEAAVVYCGPPEKDDYAVRLVGSPDPTSGRVEMKMFGQWGTLCASRFNSAGVVCRQLHLPSSGATTTTKFGGGSGVAWSEGFLCNSNDSSLTNCYRYHSYWDNCTHSDDVGIMCEAIGDYSKYRLPDFPTGAIIGVTVGGVLLIVLLMFSIAFAVSRRRLRKGASSAITTQQHIANK